MKTLLDPNARRTTPAKALGLAALSTLVMLAAFADERRQETLAGSIATQSAAVFVTDGSLQLPTDYRRWEHVGTRIKADGRSVLDGTPIVTPQVMDAYIEPSAFESYQRSGQWPDGTQIIKEISVIRTGTGCDKTTLVCSTEFGTGIFEAAYAGIGMMVKDRHRFPNSAGNWGYFSFVTTGTSPQRTATVRPHDQCASCHERLASKTDFVFSASHIGLLRSNAR